MESADSAAIRESALSLIGLPPRNGSSGVAVSACVMAARHPDEGTRVTIGRSLGERALAAISEELAGRTPTGIIDARLAGSDEASCEDPPGEGVRSAFIEGERCYRLELRVAADE